MKTSAEFYAFLQKIGIEKNEIRYYLTDVSDVFLYIEVKIKDATLHAWIDVDEVAMDLGDNFLLELYEPNLKVLFDKYFFRFELKQ